MANTLKFGAGKWATANGTALAYNDENNNFKPLPFTFTRASKGTVVNQSGLIEEVGTGDPRIDFQGNTKGALLLEPQRLNYVGQSETFTGYWGLQGASLIADNNVKNPTGNTFSNILNSTSTGTFKSINKSESSAWDSKTLTMSCFAKKKTNDFIYFHNIGSVSGSPSVYFNIGSGTLGSVGSAWSNAKIENYGNGWYRCSAKITFGTDTNYIYIANSDGNNNNSSTIGSQTYIWGTQIEEGSYPTSYIPTQGSAVTRVTETNSQTPPSGVIGQTEGSVYWEINVQTTVATANENLLNIDNGSFGNTIYFSKSTTGALVGEIYVSGVQQASFTKTNITKGVHKMAIGYANNNTAFFVDGVQVGTTDTSCTIPPLNRIQLGNGVLGPSDCLSNDLKLYNTRLSNSELAALTTI